MTASEDYYGYSDREFYNKEYKDKYDLLAINQINKYIWSKAKDELSVLQTDSTSEIAYKESIWKISSWTTPTQSSEIVPIFPVNENFGTGFTSNLSYILYDYVFSSASGTFWPIEKERATYTIVGEIPNIYYLKNFVYEKLRKFDISARAINDNDPQSLINFKYIRVDQPNFIIQEVRTPDSQFPRYQTTINLTYEFTRTRVEI